MAANTVRYAPKFTRQMVALARSGRTAAAPVTEVATRALD